VRGRDDALPLLGDERRALAHPGADDEFVRLALELAHHGIDRDRHTRDDGRGVGVHQAGHLLPIPATERAHLDRRHQRTSSTQAQDPR
jgi:hypothetical protein